MSLLNDDELFAAYKTVSPDKEWALGGMENANKFANAIEAAVVRKLATVSVEPCAFCDDNYTTLYVSEDIAAAENAAIMLYTAEALAAARAQALEEAAKRIEGPNNNYGAVIRALIGGPT